jgi:hypothetical protein
VSGCGPRKEPVPRTRDEIFAERQSLPTIYITEKSHRRFTAPVSKALHVDPETKELAWPALACHNPDCPGREADGTPYLFIEPDGASFVTTDGQVGYDAKRAKRRGGGECPMCLARRVPAKETPQQRQEYLQYVRLYEPPDSAKRREALDEQLQARVRYERRRGGVPRPPNMAGKDGTRAPSTPAGER